MLEITNPEKTYLVSLLESALTDLRSEIHHTDDFSFRQNLKENESLVHQLIDKLQSLQS